MPATGAYGNVHPAGKGGDMKTRKTRTVATLVTSAALALSFPAAGAFADKGGVPNANSNKPCPAKGKGKGPKKSAPNTKGKKCGFVS
jgi:hypothetical protein